MYHHATMLHGSIGTVACWYQRSCWNCNGDAKYTWSRKNFCLSTDNSLYLENGTTQTGEQEVICILSNDIAIDREWPNHHKSSLFLHRQTQHYVVP